MDRREIFERNLLALSDRNPGLCSRLSVAETTLNRYRFPESRSGEIVPALTDKSGSAHPLHSMIDPGREGERLVAGLAGDGPSSTGFLVFLGLGGGYAPQAALKRGDVTHVMVIDFDINGIAELFCSKEYIALLRDPRFSLWVDPDVDELKNFILEEYRPALCGGIRTVPLRTRTTADISGFNAVAEAIRQTVEKVSSDYSVQAYFGSRWFSNIIRNLKAAEAQTGSVPPVREAAICAAGPSLDQQIEQIAQYKERKVFIISCDTALPALLYRGIQPDAAVSIDCQHISYYHFMGCNSRNIPLFLDIASPPLLLRFSDSPFFFSGGHPLALYVSQNWRPLPMLDTSGGNVTYACLSLAESLGAKRITLFGADFSYPGGRAYAKGTYINPFFLQSQNRCAPLEARLSSFLYRSPFLPPEEPQAGGARKNYYETSSLRFYRKMLEQKANMMEADITVAPGMGVPVNPGREKAHNRGGGIITLFTAGKARMGCDEFLEQYRKAITALPAADCASLDSYYRNLDPGARQVFTTLLPQAAAHLRRNSYCKPGELVEELKRAAAGEIQRVLEACRALP